MKDDYIKFGLFVVAMSVLTFYSCSKINELTDENRRLQSVVWEQQAILEAEGINFVSRFELKETVR